MSRTLPTHNPTRSTRVAALLLAAGALLAACGDSDDDATIDPTPTTVAPDGADTGTDTGTDAGGAAGETMPAEDAGELLLDGTHSAWLASVDGEIAVLEPVEVLSGEEAQAAAEEDGDPAAEEGLPNDVYVRPVDGLFYGVRLADDAAVELLECSEGCELVTVDRDEFVSGAVAPYGAPRPLVTVIVESGEVTSLVEQYLP